MIHKTLINFINQKISYHINDSDSTEEYKKRGKIKKGSFIEKSTVPILSEPKYVAVTTRGKGGSEFLDTLTDVVKVQ